MLLVTTVVILQALRDAPHAQLMEILGPVGLAYRESADTPEGFSALPEGAVDAYPTYFNWRKASIYSGSNEVQRTIIAKAILKF